MNNIPKITPVILAGGFGTRLWPLSRKSYPKQFSHLVGSTTLFQESAMRLQSSSILEFEKPITITNDDFRFIVVDQLESISINSGPILIEPSAKGTASAILAAAMFSANEDDNTILLVCPSDHLIPDRASFHSDILKGISAVEAGNLMTLGVFPTYPETGYGYLELEKTSDFGVSKVSRFVEKPQKGDAKKMLKANNYLWNSGIFLFRAKDIIKAFKNHCSELLHPVEASIKKAESDLGFLRLDSKSWDMCKSISIDYAIMEHASNVMVVPFSGHWSDLGNWQAIWDSQVSDGDGVVLSENATAIECKNTLLRSESSNQQIVGIGLDNIVAVAMSDAVLVADKNRTQDVKALVEALRENKISQADTLPKNYRPWGWYETLINKGHFQVKRLFVNPGASLSLQSHRHRSENWTVVEGSGSVTIDEEVKLITKGQSAYIPVGAVHRLENPEKVPLVLIEVQTGTYLGEDDIIRYEDIYKRL